MRRVSDTSSSSSPCTSCAPRSVDTEPITKEPTECSNICHILSDGVRETKISSKVHMISIVSTAIPLDDAGTAMVAVTPSPHEWDKNYFQTVVTHSNDQTATTPPEGNDIIEGTTKRDEAENIKQSILIFESDEKRRGLSRNESSAQPRLKPAQSAETVPTTSTDITFHKEEEIEAATAVNTLISSPFQSLPFTPKCLLKNDAFCIMTPPPSQKQRYLHKIRNRSATKKSPFVQKGVVKNAKYKLLIKQQQQKLCFQPPQRRRSRQGSSSCSNSSSDDGIVSYRIDEINKKIKEMETMKRVSRRVKEMALNRKQQKQFSFASSFLNSKSTTAMPTIAHHKGGFTETTKNKKIFRSRLIMNYKIDDETNTIPKITKEGIINTHNTPSPDGSSISDHCYQKDTIPAAELSSTFKLYNDKGKWVGKNSNESEDNNEFNDDNDDIHSEEDNPTTANESNMESNIDKETIISDRTGKELPALSGSSSMQRTLDSPSGPRKIRTTEGSIYAKIQALRSSPAYRSKVRGGIFFEKSLAMISAEVAFDCIEDSIDDDYVEISIDDETQSSSGNDNLGQFQRRGCAKHNGLRGCVVSSGSIIDSNTASMNLLVNKLEGNGPHCTESSINNSSRHNSSNNNNDIDQDRMRNSHSSPAEKQSGADDSFVKENPNHLSSISSICMGTAPIQSYAGAIDSPITTNGISIEISRQPTLRRGEANEHVSPSRIKEETKKEDLSIIKTEQHGHLIRTTESRATSDDRKSQSVCGSQGVTKNEKENASSSSKEKSSQIGGIVRKKKKKKRGKRTEQSTNSVFSLFGMHGRRGRMMR